MHSRHRKLEDLGDDTPHIPLEYYDNNDGFWDEWIGYKEKMRGTVPILTKFPVFKH